MNILFTCAGRRNYLINYFKEALKGRGKVYATDSNLTAAALAEADVAIHVPSIYDDTYIDTILEIVKKNNIKAVIPLIDLELPILAASKELFSKINVQVIVSSSSVIDITFDKLQTIRFLETVGLGSPKSFVSLNEAKDALENGSLRFPVILKPRWGSGSIGIDIADDTTELELVYQLLAKRLSRTILAKANSGKADAAILIQEKITGVEYGIDVLNNLNGEYVGTFARKKIGMRAGSTDKAISVLNSDLESIGQRIGSHLKHIGNLDCDVLKSGDNYYVIDLNPRFGGGYPFSHLAGINTPAIYLEWLSNGNNIDQYINYKPGVLHAKYDKLIRVNTP
ncbi:ATP-grasp domain-containing protein [Emticicia sp. TH156]|uniref:ATP-grasp domain-containing protein n=1 Tax=Emticicia sp. TH156 TaxID=2067454 RepID=UPI000C784BFD|nr:ATP-grasp domain-containing protein [Emticicia sp. TH156]PLK42250.1 ATP-dependent carboxylate-amine ligase [Emticicia sp. TH156]